MPESLLDQIHAARSQAEANGQPEFARWLTAHADEACPAAIAQAMAMDDTGVPCADCGLDCDARPHQLFGVGCGPCDHTPTCHPYRAATEPPAPDAFRADAVKEAVELLAAHTYEGHTPASHWREHGRGLKASNECKLIRRFAPLLATLDEAEQHANEAERVLAIERTCSTCFAQPDRKTCVCDGRKTRDAEIEGLRAHVYTLGNQNATLTRQLETARNGLQKIGARFCVYDQPGSGPSFGGGRCPGPADMNDLCAHRTAREALAAIDAPAAEDKDGRDDGSGGPDGGTVTSDAERLAERRPVTPPEPANAQRSEAAPVPMVLHCLKCGLQHIDVDDETGNWATTRTHRKHLCKPSDGGCGTVWKPFDHPTVGVKEVPPSAPPIWWRRAMHSDFDEDYVRPIPTQQPDGDVMVLTFEEWERINYGEVFRNHDRRDYAAHVAQKAWNARQPEIDALRTVVEVAKRALKEFNESEDSDVVYVRMEELRVALAKAGGGK